MISAILNANSQPRRRKVQYRLEHGGTWRLSPAQRCCFDSSSGSAIVACGDWAGGRRVEGHSYVGWLPPTGFWGCCVLKEKREPTSECSAFSSSEFVGGLSSPRCLAENELARPMRSSVEERYGRRKGCSSGSLESKSPEVPLTWALPRCE